MTNQNRGSAQGLAQQSAKTERIVAFPLSGRRATIRQAAAALENVHGEAAIVHWRAACRKLAEELRTIGCDDDEVHFQVLDFQTEVQLEMMRRYTDRLEAGLDTGAETGHIART